MTVRFTRDLQPMDFTQNGPRELSDYGRNNGGHQKAFSIIGWGAAVATVAYMVLFVVFGTMPDFGVDVTSNADILAIVCLSGSAAFTGSVLMRYFRRYYAAIFGFAFLLLYSVVAFLVLVVFP